MTTVPTQGEVEAHFSIDERDDDMLISERDWQFGWRFVARRPKFMSNDEWRPVAKRIVAALSSPPPQEPMIPEGMALVPREPTEAMLREGAASQNDFTSKSGLYPRTQAVWSAMLAVAPEPENEGERDAFNRGVEAAGEAQVNLVRMAEHERELRRRAEEAFDLVAPFVAKFAAAVPHYAGGTPRFPGSSFLHDPTPGYQVALTSIATPPCGAPTSPTIGDLRLLADAFAAAQQLRPAPHPSPVPTAPEGMVPSDALPRDLPMPPYRFQQQDHSGGSLAAFPVPTAPESEVGRVKTAVLDRAFANTAPIEWSDSDWSHLAAALHSSPVPTAPDSERSILRDAYVSGFEQALYNRDLVPDDYFDAWVAVAGCPSPETKVGEPVPAALHPPAPSREEITAAMVDAACRAWQQYPRGRGSWRELMRAALEAALSSKGTDRQDDQSGERAREEIERVMRVINDMRRAGFSDWADKVQNALEGDYAD